MKTLIEITERLGRLVRNGRARTGQKRGALEGIRKDMQACADHGNPPHMRRALKRMIHEGDFSNNEKHEAFRLLDKICPRKWRNNKFHLRIGILNQRRGIVHRSSRQ